MADLPNAVRNRLVDYLRGAGAPAAVAGIYLDLFNGDPQAAGTSVLAAVTGSANRLNVTAALGAAVNGVSTNAAVINIITTATGGATVTHMGMYDAAAAGTLLASHALTSGNLVVTTGNAVQINASGLSLAIN
jgi:hypothetical protein